MIRFFGGGYDGSVYHGNERFMTARPRRPLLFRFAYFPVPFPDIRL